MDQTPFAERLVTAKYENANLKKFENNPRFLAREHGHYANESLPDCSANFGRAKKLFGQMKDSYGIKVALIDCVVGKNDDGKIAVFTVVEQIEGKQLEEATLPAEAKDELDSLLASLAQYYYDAYTNKTRCWNDNKLSQFMYGHKYGEKDNHFYLVDVDPFFTYNPPDEHQMINEMYMIGCEIIDTEKKFEKPTKLTGARNKCLEIFNIILTLSKAKQILKKANDLDSLVRVIIKNLAA